VRKLYVPDPLGSTVALLDNTQTQTDTFTYWPYGEVRTRTGTTPTPFQYVGTKGCYQDSSSRTYMRARVLDVQQGRWQTQDPIGFEGGDWNLYRYTVNRPVQDTDPSGQGCGPAAPVPGGAAGTPGGGGGLMQPPPGMMCPKGKPCYVTCYHGHSTNYWNGHGVGCPKHTRPMKGNQPGDCSTYCPQYGLPPSFPPGSTIHFFPSKGKKLPFPNRSCVICDCGPFYGDPSKWGNRPSCWVDIYVGVTGTCEGDWCCVL
jgi:RHS repeat-associated protein